MRYLYSAICKNVYELKHQKYVSGVKDQAIFTIENKGWYVNIGGEFSLYVGMERPNLQIGDILELTLTKKAP